MPLFLFLLVFVVVTAATGLSWLSVSVLAGLPCPEPDKVVALSFLLTMVPTVALAVAWAVGEWRRS